MIWGCGEGLNVCWKSVAQWKSFMKHLQVQRLLPGITRVWLCFLNEEMIHKQSLGFPIGIDSPFPSGFQDLM